MHEAFAEVVQYDPAPGIAVAKQPPKPIEAVAPQQKPEGEGYQWIGGYWGWDEDRSDFLWISGVWRIPPPEDAVGARLLGRNRGPLAVGFRLLGPRLASPRASRSSTCPRHRPPWRPAPAARPPPTTTSGARLLGLAPEPLPVANPLLGPGPDFLGVDPLALRVDAQRLRLRAGPLGLHLAASRVSFCPVYFHRPIYLHAGYRFVPSVVIYGNVLHQHLFCRPQYGHYYFGDYYASLRAVGHLPWFSLYHSRRPASRFTPITAGISATGSPTGSTQVHRWHRYHRDNEHARPLHTLDDIRRVASHSNHDGGRGHRPMVGSLDEQRHGDRFPVRLERLTHDRHEASSRRGRDVHELAGRRAELERGLREKLGHENPDMGPAANRRR